MKLKYWKNYSLEELKKLIKEKPLTKERIKYVLQNKIEKIVFDDADTSLIRPGVVNHKYIIHIGLREPLEERKISLIHEICHAFYEAGALEAEEMIEKEAQRFYKENKDFVEELYLRLFNEAKTETR